MIVGASAQTEIQDACEAAHAAASFLYFVRKARSKWLESQDERPHWFDNQDQPLQTFRHLAEAAPIYP
jgi:hypothetical protein